MNRAQRVAGVAVLAALAVATSACQRSTEPAVSTRVKVTLKEWSVKPAVAFVPAGTVTFVVHNSGKVDHELVVLRTNRPAKELDLASTGDVYEVGRIGKLSPVDAGKTDKLTLSLKVGHYALICNLPGHYRAGQLADFSVG